jgi:protein-tyrosine phosphatase
MVCLGNICRSPLAEELLRSKVNNSVVVDSAGTSAYHAGEAPDSRMIRTARKYGVNLSKIRARQFTVSDFDRFDIIYAMDEENMKNILRLARNASDIQKIRRILDETYPGEEMDVPDPYFGGEGPARTGHA